MSYPYSTIERPVFRTERLIVTIPEPQHAGRMLDFFQRNKEHLAPWSPPRAADFYTETFWREFLAAALGEFKRNHFIWLGLYPKDDPERPIIGTLTFTEIVRGAFQSCYMGYNLDKDYQGQQLMYEAIQPAIRYVFDTMKLHRIMANHVPHNTRSGNLLKKLGFIAEGTARKYLYINGEWQDHVLTSLTNDELESPQIWR